MNYIPLNIKTNNSLLTSLIDINALALECKRLNINEIAILDDNMFGVLDFYKIMTKNNIKPIIGLNIKINDKDIYLYAKNYVGYQNLCYICTNDKSIDVLKENNDGLLCIIPYYENILYDELSKIYENIYVSYKTREERDNIQNRKCVYINEVRVLKKEDKPYLKYIYMIKNGVKLSDKKEYNFDNDCYLLNNEEALKHIKEEDLINYKEISDMCNLKIEKSEKLLPRYSLDPNFDEYKYLTELCKKGLLKRLNNKVPIKYANRLMYELSIINKMGFCNYFLVVWDYVKYAKRNNILVGPGRGSAAGSLACYSLGITDIDPIKYDLLFERFLNPERVTMPDIDMDFDSEKRDEVIKYVQNKYGNKKVAQIITFSKLKSKQVLRDIFRIFDVEQTKTDDFIKLIDSNLSLEDNKNNFLVSSVLSKDTLLSRIYDISMHLENLKRQTSIHAAGVIISSECLDRYIPLYKISDSEFVTGYDMTYLEELGLLKMDFLSITNLTLINSLLNEIKNINFSSIPLDDKDTIEIFRKVDTDGIFQFESTGIKNVLRKFSVTSFDDLIAIIALFRPGPINNIDSYIKRKEGKEKITYICDDLKPVLESTYGIIIYQEQIMQIANIMAGYTLGEADVLRRAMSKKKHEIMDNEREKFILKSKNKGYSEKVSNEVFDLIYKFADYGFNKSHSVGYATVSFKMAYLKAHYRIYFMKHLLNMVIGSNAKTRQYINECKENNINILLPCVNNSDSVYKIENGSLRFPISLIHNLGIGAIKEIIEEREKGLFKDFFDFVKRCYGKNINKKVLELLINASTLDCFGYNHNTLISNIDSVINYAELTKDLDETLINKPEIEIKDEFEPNELVKREYLSFGFYLSYHLVQNYRKNNITTLDIKTYFNKIINIYLLIDNVKTSKTKKDEKMAFITASDEFGEIDMVMFPREYEKFYNLSKGEVVLVKAKVEKRINRFQLVINDISRF